MNAKVSQEQPVYIDLENVPVLGKHQSTSIDVYVHGYWGSMITIYITRDWTAPDEGPMPTESPWRVKINHASGGRDTKAVQSDADAAEAFGRAMTEVAQFVRYLEDKWVRMETVHREERAAARAAAARQMAEDPPLGMRTAEQITQTLSSALMRRGPGAEMRISTFDRGEKTEWVMSAKRTAHQVRFMNRHGANITRAKFVELLSQCSARSGTIRSQ